MFFVFVVVVCCLFLFTDLAAKKADAEIKAPSAVSKFASVDPGIVQNIVLHALPASGIMSSWGGVPRRQRLKFPLPYRSKFRSFC